MKQLPSKPSLDFLRKEAKDLLAALRETKPRATLGLAQRTLAERYGFRAWTDLKAEVGRRIAAEEPADPKLADELAAVFGLGETSGPMVRVLRDGDGGTWSLETEAGRWSARTVYDSVGLDSAESSVRLSVSLPGLSMAYAAGDDETVAGAWGAASTSDGRPVTTQTVFQAASVSSR